MRVPTGCRERITAAVKKSGGRPDDAKPPARFASWHSAVYPSDFPSGSGRGRYRSGKSRDACGAVEVSIGSDPTSLEAWILKTAVHAASGACEKAQETAQAVKHDGIVKSTYCSLRDHFEAFAGVRLHFKNSSQAPQTA